MLYRVRLQYGITLEAPSHEEAHRRAREMMKATPEAFIGSVEDASIARSSSVVKRLVTGK